MHSKSFRYACIHHAIFIYSQSIQCAFTPPSPVHSPIHSPPFTHQSITIYQHSLVHPSPFTPFSPIDGVLVLFHLQFWREAHKLIVYVVGLHWVVVGSVLLWLLLLLLLLLLVMKVAAAVVVVVLVLVK